jgi:hypothetical protein
MAHLQGDAGLAAYDSTGSVAQTVMLGRMMAVKLGGGHVEAGADLAARKQRFSLSVGFLRRLSGRSRTGPRRRPSMFGRAPRRDDGRFRRHTRRFR